MPLPRAVADRFIPRASSWPETPQLRRSTPISPLAMNEIKSPYLCGPQLEQGLVLKQETPVQIPGRAFIPCAPSMVSEGVQFPTASMYAVSEMGDPPGISMSEKSLPRKRRNIFMRMLMAPFDFMEWILQKWMKPSEDCMRCARLTYWIVLIVGGIITTVVALAPFL